MGILLKVLRKSDSLKVLLKVLLKVNAIADCFAESYCASAIIFFFFMSSLLHTLTINADNMG